MDKRWRVALGVGAGLVVVVFVVRTFERHWDEYRRMPLELHPDPVWLLAAAGAVWLTYLLLIAAWRGVVQSWGDRLAFRRAARVWAVSSLGKYVPGKVWAIAGMAVLAREEGVRPVAATGAAVLLQLLALGTGAAVAGLGGMAALEAARPGARAVVLLVTLGAGAGIALLLWPPAHRRILQLVGLGEGEPAAAPMGALAAATLANLLAWLGYGGAMWLLARGLFGSMGLPPYAELTGAFAASYLAGLLALFAPGGVVVREALFVALLQPSLGLPRATALAVASRILLTLTEIGITLPFLLSTRRRRDDR